MERERICRIVYLPAAHEVRTLWMDRHTCQKARRKRRPGDTRAPALGTRSLPRSPRPGLSLPAHLSSISKPHEALVRCVSHCTVSVLKVLIHVNLCENYCVQQYFLVYLFSLCELSHFSFLFINVYFFKRQTNVL